MNWEQIGQTLRGETLGDFYGHSISLNGVGDIVAVGASRNDGNGTDSGQVQIYLYDGTTWNKIGDDIDGGTTGDRSGWSISLNAGATAGNIRVAVGIPQNDNNGSNAGQVRIYQYNGITWTKLGQDIEGDTALDQFGYSVSLNATGDIVAIGAPFNDKNGVLSGSVQIYEYIGTTWNKIGQNIDGVTFENLGYSISLNSGATFGNINVAIGAPQNNVNGNKSGKVRIYNYNGITWSIIGQDIYGSTVDDQFGYSVSLNANGDIVAIGEPFSNNIAKNSGSVKIYRYDGFTMWAKVGQDINGTTTNDQNGHSVSLNKTGNIVAIGKQTSLTETKPATIYKLDGNNIWTLYSNVINTLGAADKGNGYHVSLNFVGDRVAIGSQQQVNGQAQVFQLSSPSLINNICFPASTPVNTDQGIIHIEKIIPGVHTINKKRIVEITKTICTDRHLVCFEKDALGQNMPSNKTIMTKGHKVMHKGVMTKAADLLNNDHIYTVKYRGDILYNVLMENHECMTINNLVCETLNPYCDIAKMYRALQHMSPTQKNAYIDDVNQLCIPV